MLIGKNAGRETPGDVGQGGAAVNALHNDDGMRQQRFTACALYAAQRFDQ